jgi:hypothetical protein
MRSGMSTARTCRPARTCACCAAEGMTLLGRGGGAAVSAAGGMR